VLEQIQCTQKRAASRPGASTGITHTHNHKHTQPQTHTNGNTHKRKHTQTNTHTHTNTNTRRLWRLEYSPSKTKCIVLGDRKLKHIDNYQWFLGDQRLEIVASYNYLGIIISGDGSSQARTTTMANKGYANLGMLKASGFHSEGLSPLTCSNLWQRLLIPSILYGCEVWGDLPKRELNVFEQFRSVLESISTVYIEGHTMK